MATGALVGSNFLGNSRVKWVGEPPILWGRAKFSPQSLLFEFCFRRLQPEPHVYPAVLVVADNFPGNSWVPVG